jgi:tRNA (cytidine/uridine-2'-O-)-methyltransferase
MFHVVLVEPEIPPNTGNAIRLCANTGVRLHLIHPLGFEMDDSRLRRAGLDYREWARVEEHADFDAFLDTVAPARLFALTRHASRNAYDVELRPGDAFCFGSETRGLGPERLKSFPQERRLRLPMVPGSRSLNLSNAVSVLVYEAWRQQGFAGAD